MFFGRAHRSRKGALSEATVVALSVRADHEMRRNYWFAGLQLVYYSVYWSHQFQSSPPSQSILYPTSSTHSSLRLCVGCFSACCSSSWTSSWLAQATSLAVHPCCSPHLSRVSGCSLGCTRGADGSGVLFAGRNNRLCHDFDFTSHRYIPMVRGSD